MHTSGTSASMSSLSSFIRTHAEATREILQEASRIRVRSCTFVLGGNARDLLTDLWQHMDALQWVETSSALFTSSGQSHQVARGLLSLLAVFEVIHAARTRYCSRIIAWYAMAAQITFVGDKAQLFQCDKIVVS